MNFDDPNREQELIHFYESYGYEDLVKDYFLRMNEDNES